MTTEINLSPLAVACLERDAWKHVEGISKAGRNRRIHAYAVKKVAAFSDIIARIAEQEVSDYELKELERAKKVQGDVRVEEDDEEDITPMERAIMEEKSAEFENSFSLI